MLIDDDDDDDDDNKKCEDKDKTLFSLNIYVICFIKLFFLNETDFIVEHGSF